MARKGQTKIRVIQPDAKYNSLVVAKIINYAMKDGKRSASAKQMYDAMEIIAKDSKNEPLITLEQSLDNIKPRVEVRPRRIGGAVYQVPTPVKSNRQLSLAIRWLITAARARDSKQHHTFADKMATEILASLKNEGSAVQKRLEVERMAEANRAFAHLRW